VDGGGNEKREKENDGMESRDDSGFLI